MNNIGDLKTKINLEGSVREGELLRDYTTFRVGGPAQAMVFPASRGDVEKVFSYCRETGTELFVLGSGANLLVSDRGIPGITLNLTSLTAIRIEDELLRVEAGLSVNSAIEWSRDRERSSLEFMYGMPSTVGGAVWMNARCYGSEIADVVQDVTVLNAQGEIETVPFDADAWSYKVSPFQRRRDVVLEATFRSIGKPKTEIEATMNRNFADREAKGHFKLPCAGSVFKNNHEFGEPSGVLIDRCGLKGLRRGQALVSPWHANIIVNEGDALASDLRALIEDVKGRVRDRLGFLLEEEVVYAGDWTGFREDVKTESSSSP